MCVKCVAPFYIGKIFKILGANAKTELYKH